MRKEELKVESLCCYSCATTVEKELLRLKGVKMALSDHKKKTMTVEYDENLVDRRAIEARIAEVLGRFEQQV
jgi:copper chaperone CopZ